MKKNILICLMLFIATPSLAKKVDINFIQINDVYEISPVNGGEHGGLARVQTFVNEFKRKNKHTYTVLAGDFISPSAIGTAKIQGQRLNGKQIIDVFNEMHWDYATLGNHEFDLGKSVLIERLNEAKFKVISSNVTETSTNMPFKNTIKTELLDVKGVKIGIAGVMLPVPKKDFAKVSPPRIEVESLIQNLKKQGAEILIFITHQSFNDDEELAKKYPEIDLIMGGHEHENIYVRRGNNLTPIAKADANARSIYVHKLSYDTKNKSLVVDSEFHPIDSRIPEDPRIQTVVNNWVELAYNAFRNDGFNPNRIITVSKDTLDGLESNVRNQPTLLTQHIENSAYHAYTDADLSLINAGSIRLDDTIPPGPISEYDVIRILPFGGQYQQFSIPGDILERALNIGLKNKGTGGFLIHANVNYTKNSWHINGEKIDPKRHYKTVSSTFLMTQGDKNLEFLANNDRIKVISLAPIDVRKALINELKIVYPAETTPAKNLNNSPSN